MLKKISYFILILSFAFGTLKPFEGIIWNFILQKNYSIGDFFAVGFFALISAAILFGLLKKKLIAYTASVLLLAFLFLIFGLQLNQSDLIARGQNFTLAIFLLSMPFVAALFCLRSAMAERFSKIYTDITGVPLEVIGEIILYFLIFSGVSYLLLVLYKNQQSASWLINLFQVPPLLWLEIIAGVHVAAFLYRHLNKVKIDKNLQIQTTVWATWASILIALGGLFTAMLFL